MTKAVALSTTIKIFKCMELQEAESKIFFISSPLNVLVLKLKINIVKMVGCRQII